MAVGTGDGTPGAGAPLRIGVLGAARIARAALADPVAHGGDRLVVVAARDAARARAFAAEHGVERAVDDYAAVLADDEVEVVYNPLPNGLHGHWNRAAAAAGKHVLSEKPFAANADEARRVAEAARAAGVTVVEAFHYAHHPLIHRVHAVIDDGELGEIESVEAHMTMPAPPDSDVRWSFPLAGGALMDLGCYALHALRHLARWTGGEPSVTSARAGERAGHPGVDEWLTAQLAYPGGASGLARCSMDDQGRRVTLRVRGRRGELTAVNFALPMRDDRLHVRTPAGERTEHLGTRPSYRYQLDALRTHLRAGTPFPLDLDDAVGNAELIDACYAAAGLPARAPTPVPA